MSLSKQPAPARIFASLAALAISVCLAGCTNDDVQLDETIDASEVDSTEYIPASADGPAQNVPEPNLPAVATENTEEGAKATLEYFWEAVDFARLTGETSHLALVSDDSCEFCAAYIDGWEDRYQNGQWLVTDGEIETDILDVSTYMDQDRGDEWTAISFEITQPAADLYKENEQIADEAVEQSNTEHWAADLSYDGTAGRWKIEWTGRDGEENSE